MSARFVYRPFSAEQMTKIGNRVIVEVVKPRIARAVNVNDAPAKALSTKGKRYQRYFYIKKAKGRPPVRDLDLTGNTLRAMRVVSARASRVRIGFDNPRASRIAAMNQSRDPAFWFSPEDQVKIGRIVGEEIVAGKKLATVMESSAGQRIVISRSAA
ncbi:MAG: hypothetical protein ABSC23_03760 [Bryobacteraceae bacterium]|jgi:hypothetical protein